MVPVFVNALVRPFLRAWVRSSSQSWRALSVPDRSSVVHAQGANADRLLLIGNGVSVSYGVRSHDLGLAGHLARYLTAITGRGTTIDVRAWPDITNDEVLAILADAEAAKYDAVITTIGATDSVQLGSLRQWRDTATKVIATLRERSGTARIYFVGVPLSSALVAMPWFFRVLIEAHIRRVNEVTVDVCDRDERATFVAFEPVPSRVIEKIGRDQYEGWAHVLAGPIADGLDEQVHPHSLVADERARLESLHGMEILDSVGDDDVRQLVATARKLFGVTGAGLNLIDLERQWTLASAGHGVSSMPRRDSVCTSTIESTGLLIVEDTHLDERYRAKDWANGEHAVRFYAGHPIESPDGYRIGALCVVDEVPHRFTEADRSLLRELALQVQELLWSKHRP